MPTMWEELAILQRWSDDRVCDGTCGTLQYIYIYTESINQNLAKAQITHKMAQPSKITPTSTIFLNSIFLKAYTARFIADH